MTDQLSLLHITTVQSKVNILAEEQPIVVLSTSKSDLTSGRGPFVWQCGKDAEVGEDKRSAMVIATRTFRLGYRH